MENHLFLSPTFTFDCKNQIYIKLRRQTIELGQMFLDRKILLEMLPIGGSKLADSSVARR